MITDWTLIFKLKRLSWTCSFFMFLAYQLLFQSFVVVNSLFIFTRLWRCDNKCAHCLLPITHWMNATQSSIWGDDKLCLVKSGKSWNYWLIFGSCQKQSESINRLKLKRQESTGSSEVTCNIKAPATANAWKRPLNGYHSPRHSITRAITRFTEFFWLAHDHKNLFRLSLYRSNTETG